MKRMTMIAAALGTALLAACGGDDEDAAQAAVSRDTVAARPPGGVAVAWDRRAPRMTAEEMERARTDTSWMEVVELDRVPGGAIRPNPERWEQITPQAVNTTPQHAPLTDGAEGPSVLRAQILLDRALFSPGIMDGRWGKNTAEAVYWFQQANGLPRTARVDSATFAALRQAANAPDQLIVAHRLTAGDVEGPFVAIPEDIYEHAEMECSCYESLTEKLSEMFHVTPDLLERLNPGVELDGLRAGQTLQVPAVRESGAEGRGQVARIVVSGKGTYVHGMDAQGKILYHFPSTLGGRYSPSPTGDYSVNHVANDPEWHYQPDILVGVPDDEPDAMIPAGPNVAVGTVWIDLSEPHYGIHGTAEPQTIGYASSNGCVRLTNWDVEFLARHVSPGTPVEFRDIEGRAGSGEPTPTAGERASSSSSSSARPSTGGGSTRSASPPRPAREPAKSPAPTIAASTADEDTADEHAGHEGHTPR